VVLAVISYLGHAKPFYDNDMMMMNRGIPSPKFGKINMPSIGRVVGFPYILVKIAKRYFGDVMSLYAIHYFSLV